MWGHYGPGLQLPTECIAFIIEKILLFCTFILKLVDRNSMSFQLIIKIYNDLLIICLANCLVILGIF